MEYISNCGRLLRRGIFSRETYILKASSLLDLTGGLVFVDVSLGPLQEALECEVVVLWVVGDVVPQREPRHKKPEKHEADTKDGSRSPVLPEGRGGDETDG